jgi:uncharacterized protein YecE (DUF72 family)
MAAKILVGTCSWTDASLVESGRFYPPDADTAEERLRFYASKYPIVEVDSSYYGLPSERNAALWVERTPAEFTFNIKAFALLTHHPTPPRSLPKDLREALPAEVVAEKRNLYYKDVPADVRDAVWERFANAILPLDSAGKLGVVLFQFPPWFVPGTDSWRYVEEVKQRLAQYAVAVEFRNHLWLNERNRESTFRSLARLDLPFVCVDEPQGLPNSVPPVSTATAQIALIRFHGRNREMWNKRGVGAADRFDYLYSKDELREWVGPVEQLVHQANEVHVLFNNCREDKAVRNAGEFMQMLMPLESRAAADVVTPDEIREDQRQELGPAA